ncbi:glycosyltransferase family 2 protein [Prosthecobacter sp.]|uniref:glycosyltransferase family 2 protein n=1 Tax=Prosthecobacter sp. TaxID=1965333 RepID=UPI0037851247
MSRPTIGVLIRFKNSAATLPHVLQRLQAQTIRPLFILGVDTGSTDDSARLISKTGGRVIAWNGPYHHARVLNHGLRHLHTDLVLVLSSHTTLEDDDAVERMLGAFTDPRVACVSARWDDDPFYSDAITWDELWAKGLKFGSIYSNSMGMLRRKAWTTAPFDESLVTAEDYAWAIEQLKRGGICKRLHLRFGYERSGHDRTFEFAQLVFQFARRYKLRVAWLGALRSMQQMLTAVFMCRPDSAPPALHYDRLKAWAAMRFTAASSFSVR